MEPLFTLGRIDDDSGTTVVLYRQAFPPGIRERFPVQLIVEWQFNERETTALPSDEEQEKANEFGDAVRQALEASNEAILAVVSTGNGHKEWYYYCQDAKRLERLFNLHVCGRSVPVHLHSGLDAQWLVYEGFVTPFAANA